MTLEMKSFSEVWFSYIEKYYDLTYDNPNIHSKYISSNINIRIEHVLKYPKFRWNFFELSCNPSITFEDIKNNLHLPWHWNEGIVYRKDITIETIKNNLHLPWNYRALLIFNENITCKKIENNKKLLFWNPDMEKTIKNNKKFLKNDKNLIKKYYDMLHDYDFRSYISKYADWEDIVENLDIDWCWFNMMTNKNITWKIIKEHPGLFNIHNNPHCTYGIRKITIEDYKELPDIPWNYSILSHNENFTLDFIKENLDKKWDWYEISKRQDITIEDIKNNLHLPWKWYELSTNQNIKWEDIISNPELPWKWANLLSYNSNITYLHILENLDNPNIRNNLGYYSLNPNMRLDLIEMVKDRINFSDWNWIGMLSKNFTNWRIEYEEMARIQERTLKLKPELLEVVYHPDYYFPREIYKFEDENINFTKEELITLFNKNHKFGIYNKIK